jgi:glycine dehydrogenase subunit 1
LRKLLYGFPSGCGGFRRFQHVQSLLDKNTSAVDFMNFCGAGCWQHHVPAVVDEIINRAEFVSAYCGGDYSDLGKYLTRFEFNSMLGELVDLDGLPHPHDDGCGMSKRSATPAQARTRISPST